MSDRVWEIDRGMVSSDSLAFLREGGRRYIVDTPKLILKKFEHELLKSDWHSVRDGLEVKLCHPPISEESDELDLSQQEIFIFCRNQDRAKRATAIVRRAEVKIETRLKSMSGRWEK